MRTGVGLLAIMTLLATPAYCSARQAPVIGKAGPAQADAEPLYSVAFAADQELTGRLIEITPAPDDQKDAVKIIELLGIPYAQAPVGERRWRASQPARQLPESPFSALAPAPACPQSSIPGKAFQVASAGQEAPEHAMASSEDCLYLNLWAPLAGQQLPVMVWIHGGGLVRGSGSHPGQNGRALAAMGAVVITFNYRLGPLGFFWLPELADEDGWQANFGLMDQVSLLRWVKMHVQRFGGDPENVTLFGSSSGGAGVLHLLTAPALQKEALFQRAISQSGGGAGRHLPLQAQQGGSAEKIARKFVRDLDSRQSCGSASSVEPFVDLNFAQVRTKFGLATALRHCVSVAQLQRAFGGEWNAQGRQIRPEARHYPYRDGALVTQTNLLAAMAAPEVRPVPLLLGYAENEASVVGGRGQALSVQKMSGYRRQLALPDLDPDGEDAGSPRPQRASPRAPLAEQYRDLVYALPAHLLASLHAQLHGAETFLYRYAWSPGGRSGPPPGHAADVRAIFATGRWWRPGPLNPVELEHAHAMMQAWLAFARSGNPSTSRWPWPRYGADGSVVRIANTKVGRATEFVPGDWDRELRPATEALRARYAAGRPSQSR